MDRFDAAGTSVVMISVDARADSVDLARREGTRVPLLADPGLKTAIAWGVAMKGRDIAVPAVFLVRPDRTVPYRYVGESMMDRPSADELVRRARAERTKP